MLLVGQNKNTTVGHYKDTSVGQNKNTTVGHYKDTSSTSKQEHH